ncbi:MAG: Ig-like domain-containing protein [Clostridiales bacterium]
MISLFSKKNRKIVVLLSAIIILIIVALAAYIIKGEVKGNGNEKAFKMNHEALLAESCSLDNRSGVSQGESMEIYFNQLISEDIAKDITISPAIDGKWQGYDNRLVFTPASRWAAGTFYEVTVDNTSIIGSMGKKLKESATFSFETQDSALRIPASATFEVDQRQYSFKPKEKIVLNAAYDDIEGNVDTVASVKVWKFSSSHDFAKSFLPLFNLPQWATVSRNKFMADTDGLKYLGKKDVHLKDGKINYDTLPSGYYLFRLVVNGAACDVAVSVDNADVYYCYDGSNIYAWSHYNGDPIVGGKLRIGKNVAMFDENGCAKIEYNNSKAATSLHPQNIVMEIVNKDYNHIVFLTPENLPTPQYSGNLIVNNKKLKNGDTLTYGGRVEKSLYMEENVDNATVVIKNKKQIIEKTIVEVKNGNFFGSFKKMNLPDGNYQLVLSVKNQIVASQTIIMDNKNQQYGHLLVSKSAEAVYNGNEITFRVKAVTKNGKPIKALDIKASEGTSVGLTDKNGETLFYLPVEGNRELPMMTKEITFSSAIGEIGTISATETFVLVNRGSVGKENGALVKYSVVNGKLIKEGYSGGNLSNEPELAPVAPVATSEKSSYISFVPLKNDFLINKDKSENAGFYVGYSNGTYEVSTPIAVNAFEADIEMQSDYNIVAGNKLELYPVVKGMDNPLIMAELYRGAVPVGLEGEAIHNEGQNVSLSSTPLVSAMAKNGYISLRTNKLNGDYYLRVWAKNKTGISVSRYAPVNIRDGGVILSDVQSFYPENQNINIDFSALGNNGSYQVVLGDAVVDEGELGENISVSLGTLKQGKYKGTINIWNNVGIVATENFDFTVYKKEPGFISVKEGSAPNALMYLTVDTKEKDYFKKAMAINLLPGNQLLQVMGRNTLYGALGEDSGFLATYINEDLSYYQNSDGSFSRLPGSNGDLLLSNLVAEDKSAVFDREALKSYYLEKINKTTDVEMMALCYWGLSLLGEPPLESMNYHLTDNSFNDKAKLYLAKAFLVSGNKQSALSIYDSLARDLSTSDNKTSFAKPEQQDSIFKALFMLDLSMELKTNDTQGLLDYLMESKMTTQTNRYLMSLCLLNYIDIDGVSFGAEKKNNKETVLSVLAQDKDYDDKISGKYSVNSEKTDTVTLGSTVKLSVNWSDEYDENDLYMIYFTPSETLSFWPQKDLTLDHGHVMYLTMANKADIYFYANQVGENFMGDIYVMNLTRGKILGKVAVNDLVVSE